MLGMFLSVHFTAQLALNVELSTLVVEQRYCNNNSFSKLHDILYFSINQKPMMN